LPTATKEALAWLRELLARCIQRSLPDPILACAFATWMMKGKIEKAEVPSIGDLIEMAQLEGVKFVACRMTMDMMELKPEDLIDGVEVQTAEDYLKHARNCKINMFT
jgi:peroxiredoxin family protein